MKWTATPESSLHDSICNDNSGNELGWISDCADRYEAYFSEPRAAVFLGAYKTPRLAQQAVERELLRKWFKCHWKEYQNECVYLWVNMIYLSGVANNRKQKPAILARAKREFLEQL
jgi:hypothetical protein